MNILFVIPPNSLEERYGKLKNVGTIYPSMGIASVAPVSEKLGFTVKVLDCEAIGMGYDALEEEIKKINPDLIGMQTFCSTMNRAIEVAKRAKKVSGGKIKTVLGGVQATLFPEEYCKNESIDFIVVGEGEIVFENLLKALEKCESFENIKGLAWKKEGKVIVNEQEKLIKNIDHLPFPARHLFDMKYYHPSAQIRGSKTFHIITSRGCPHRCGFCSCHKTFGRTYRFMSVDRVITEIRHLVNDYGIDSLQFYDDSLTVHRKRIIELCNAIIDEKLVMPWACFARVDEVDTELLKIMKKAGCYQIFYGVESGSQRLLDLMKKDITVEQCRKAFAITKAEGIQALGSFIMGLPTETREESEMTAKIAIELDADYAHWEIFTPHPGTDLFQIALENGKLLSSDWNDFSTWTEEPVYLPNGRTVDELKSLRSKAYKKFYMRPSYVLKMILNLSKLPAKRVFNLLLAGLNMCK